MCRAPAIRLVVVLVGLAHVDELDVAAIVQLAHARDVEIDVVRAEGWLMRRV